MVKEREPVKRPDLAKRLQGAKVFDSGRAQVGSEVPHVSMYQKSGILSLNGPAMEVIGNPSRVALVFQDGVIGVRGAHGSEHGYRPVPHSTTSDSITLASSSFVRLNGIPTDKGLTWHPAPQGEHDGYPALVLAVAEAVRREPVRTSIADELKQSKQRKAEEAAEEDGEDEGDGQIAAAS